MKKKKENKSRHSALRQMKKCSLQQARNKATTLTVLRNNSLTLRIDRELKRVHGSGR